MDNDEPEEKMEANGEIYINWNCLNQSNKDKEMRKTRSYVFAQLQGVLHIDDDLIKLFTIGRLNNKNDLATLITDIYSLSKIEYQQNESSFNESEWTEKYSKYFKKYNKCELIQKALRTYTKRFMQSKITTPQLIPFNDFVMDYIKYTLVVNNAISNILSSIEYSRKVCPLQIDLIIYGRNYKSNEDKNTMNMNMNDDQNGSWNDDEFELYSKTLY